MNANDTPRMLRHLASRLRESQGLFEVGEKGLALNKIKDVVVSLEGMADDLEKSSNPN